MQLPYEYVQALLQFNQWKPLPEDYKLKQRQNTRRSEENQIMSVQLWRMHDGSTILGQQNDKYRHVFKIELKQ